MACELERAVSFFDYDRDGDLDLYVANDVKFSFDRPVSRTTGGTLGLSGPRDFEPDPDTLYRNNGDGTFDVSDVSGIASHAGPSMGIVCTDYDRDGDPDVFVGNDSFANFLFRNNGDGTFSEVGLLSGFACDLHGKVQATMGVDCGDDNNVRLARSPHNELSVGTLLALSQPGQRAIRGSQHPVRSRNRQHCTGRMGQRTRRF